MRIKATNCATCNIELGSHNRAWQRRAMCQNCLREEIRTKRRGKLEKKYNLKKLYRMTIEEYDKLFEFQQGGCAICRKPCRTGNQLCVDHNHKTKEIRGLLCNKCNAALGHLGEDENLIWNILEYLKRTTWSKVA